MKRNPRASTDKNRRLIEGRRRAKRRVAKVAYRKESKKKIKIVSDIVTVTMPERISCSDPRERSKNVQCMQQIRKAFRSPAQVILDFSKTRAIESGGMLLTYAELHRLTRIFKKGFGIVLGDLENCTDDKILKVAQVLNQLGLLKKAKYKISINNSFEDVIYWRHSLGHITDMQKVDDDIQNTSKYIDLSTVRGLEICIQEVMGNAVEHAYKMRREDGLNIDDATHRSWYMFTNVRNDEKSQRLTVVFCDLGVGIPATLPRTHRYTLKEIGGKNVIQKSKAEGLAIKYAVEESHTWTELEHRGLGLQQIVEEVLKVPGAHLFIMSNRGCYLYQEGEWHVLQDYKDSILGTLISLSYPIVKEKVEG